MRFGFHFLDFTQPGEPESLAGLLRQSAQVAEQSGASWFSVMDHYFQMEHFQTATTPCSRATRRSASSPESLSA